ncbi:Aspartic proteinase [Mycena sanguinolenta]|uniref:Aspartic proteinase n=1 Tax=Mycena sanguinolenta TaxID=230812 RepID=A0A8H7DJI2_9AGAR|nr:Aspartic proteinase [Mycena sanguinolenta]
MVQLVFTLLPAILIVLHVGAEPVVVKDSIITLPISRRFNFTGTGTIWQKDMARIRTLMSRKAARNSARQVVSEPLSNQFTTYTASVGVGSLATVYNLLVDTGSSNTWVGAGQKYVETPHSVTYGSGEFSGTEFVDRVTLAPGLVIEKQSIGVATSSSGFDGVDGILGIGPTALTQDTLISEKSMQIPTVTDNLVNQGTIVANVMGIYFQPLTSPNGTVNDGSIAFGGADPTKFAGPVSYTRITAVAPASDFWGVDQTVRCVFLSFAKGLSLIVRTQDGLNTILELTAGIVDTGTTLIFLATDGEYLYFICTSGSLINSSTAFRRYQRATGAVLDPNTGLLRVTDVQFSVMKNLDFNIGGVTYSLTPNAQIWPRSLNSQIGGASSSIYLIVSDLGSDSGEGLDFINGYAFLERFYSVYDADNNRIGLATTSFTTVTTN